MVRNKSKIASKPDLKLGRVQMRARLGFDDPSTVFFTGFLFPHVPRTDRKMSKINLGDQAMWRGVLEAVLERIRALVWGLTDTVWGPGRHQLGAKRVSERELPIAPAPF